MPTVMDALRGAMRRHVGDTLSVPQFRCLNFIDHQPGCSVGDVASFLGVSMPTASAMVDRLARAGSVDAGTAKHDRRRAHLRMTPAGRAQLQQIRRAAHADLANLLQPCSAEDLKALQDGLDVLRRTFAPAGTRA